MSQDLILVIDDDPDTLRIIQRILASKGYRVLTAPTVHQGLLYLERESVALVILDVHLPRKNAAHLAQWFRFQAEPPFLVVMSSDHDSRAWAREHGAIGFLPKPLGFTSLLRTVRVLKRAQATREAQKPWYSLDP